MLILKLFHIVRCFSFSPCLYHFYTELQTTLWSTPGQQWLHLQSSVSVRFFFHILCLSWLFVVNFSAESSEGLSHVKSVPETKIGIGEENIMNTL